MRKNKQEKVKIHPNSICLLRINMETNKGIIIKFKLSCKINYNIEPVNL